MGRGSSPQRVVTGTARCRPLVAQLELAAAVGRVLAEVPGGLQEQRRLAPQQAGGALCSSPAVVSSSSRRRTRSSSRLPQNGVRDAGRSKSSATMVLGWRGSTMGTTGSSAFVHPLGGVVQRRVRRGR
jgi:hypothetical protein